MMMMLRKKQYHLPTTFLLLQLLVLVLLVSSFGPFVVVVAAKKDTSTTTINNNNNNGGSSSSSSSFRKPEEQLLLKKQQRQQHLEGGEEEEETKRERLKGILFSYSQQQAQHNIKKETIHHQEEDDDILLRNLQNNNNNNNNNNDDDDPCFGQQVSYRLWGQYDVMKPTYYVQCAQAIRVNADGMKNHINSLNRIFEQYHSFYDIARKPPESIGEYQPELGNTLYQEGNGQVDINLGLTQIMSNIDTSGTASLSTFWEYNTVFNKLRDGHIILPSVRQSFSSYHIMMFPERLAGNQVFEQIPSFFVDENKRLQLTLSTEIQTPPTAESRKKRQNFDENLSSTREIKTISTISGLSVAEYMEYLGNSPEIKMPYQNLGSRVNWLIKNDAFFGFNKFSMSGIPTNLLPDEIVVGYDDGTVEKFLVTIVPTNPWYTWSTKGGNSWRVNRTAAELFVNVPGKQYEIFSRASGRVAELEPGLTIPSTDSSTPTTTTTTVQKQPQEVRSDNSEVLFHEVIPDVGGYLIQDDFIVMKLSSFSTSYGNIKKLWTETVNAARDAGMKKMLVDISGNEGGSVMSGFGLIFMMFPNVEFKHFTNQWDISYNRQMTLYEDAVLPLLDLILNEVSQLGRDSFTGLIDSFPEQALEIFQIAGNATLELCESAVNPKDPTPDPTQCQQAAYLQSNITAFVTNQDLQTYINLFLSLGDTIFQYNPWTVVLQQVEKNQLITNAQLGPPSINTSITDQLLAAGPITKTRGGVQANFTEKFDLLGRTQAWVYEDIASLNEQIDYSFDEYVFVSNGISGSMAAIFPFTARQLYRNRDKSGVEVNVTLAAYGGLGKPHDFSIASHPASVQGVHLEDPIIGAAALRMVEGLIPPGVPGLEGVSQKILDYTVSIAIPPYFGDTLPVLPVVNYYDDFMEPGALPLQYVDIPLDKYVPRIYTKTSFQDPDDLPFLYADAMGEPEPPSPPPTPAPTLPPVPPTPPPDIPLLQNSGSCVHLNKGLVSIIGLSSFLAILLATINDY